MGQANPIFDNETLGWVDLIPPRQSQPKISSDLEAKWLVIGAGFTGLSCARRLAEINPKDKIILLDARELGQNASGRNSGYAVAHSHFSGAYKESDLEKYQRVDRINQVGLNSLRTLVKDNTINCDWIDSGIYHTAADSSSEIECDHFINYLKKREIKHTPLSNEEVYDHLGTSWYKKGVKVDNGALMQPAKLVFGLAENLPGNVELYENTPVLNLILDKTNKVIVPDATITADKVIMACNYEKFEGAKPKQRLVGVTLSGSITRVLTNEEFATLGSQSSWGVLSLHSGGATIRLTDDRRIAIRNTAEYNNHRLLTKKQLIKRQQIHRQAFDNRFPQLSHVPFEHLYSGVEGVSANKTNIFEKFSDNLYYAGCFNGSGITKGTAFGIGIAEYACGKNSSIVKDCLALEKAKWLPPKPLLDLGAWFTTKQRFKGVGRDR
ncbi:FAD-binding oxidoreductase [Candidatus Thioglobus sp. NP1]|uniref:NAD(P)/FAD-dependent oxidoreductase n=1 Tax=Candidatus Thioglobus sp. NP1 TaxID=2508687 RepID=UPI000DEE0AF0|nr:FAD-dependent oxidoreductase [Candidatus Thioglobus sp. NP1]AXE62385.1 FAD-dependent oxidoreductase [Candidatus Thioglobus sp. NP1]